MRPPVEAQNDVAGLCIVGVLDLRRRQQDRAVEAANAELRPRNRTAHQLFQNSCTLWVRADDFPYADAKINALPEVVAKVRHDL